MSDKPLITFFICVAAILISVVAGISITTRKYYERVTITPELLCAQQANQTMFCNELARKKVGE